MAENSIRVRKRTVVGPIVIINQTFTKGHSTAPVPIGTYLEDLIQWRACLYTRREWCEDTNHREHLRLESNGDYVTLKGTMTTADRGSPLWVRRTTREHSPGQAPSYEARQGIIDGTGNWSKAVTAGSQIIGNISFGSGMTSGTTVTPSIPASVPAKSVVDFSVYGPKGWKRYQPLNPKVSTSQFIAELHDLPRIPFRLFQLAKFFRSLGKEYLNIEFGWKPFLMDLKSFLKEVLNFNERWEQLLRDNGKAVHREGPIYKDEGSSSSVTTGTGEILSPTYPTGAYPGPIGTLTNSKTTTTSTYIKYWFSGSFQYWLAPFDTARYYEQIARIVYGIDLTPRLVYELVPWSWLLDWATSIGDSISNFTEAAVDGLVAKYAYCMGHYVKVTTDTWVGPLSRASTTLTEEVKARDQATPYGFGLNVDSFSSRQKAILAALLLARS